ncbi:flavin-dependent dehydrogenase [Micromonospora pisi]|uniref:Flavin-dependent dehydrogenase n=1 Tax=Micromonospora pisi TaxID=589240 RepID=A0A495JD52_9ACTN|nr:FAD-dependent monooxygenase [Micromonospora pisi]RKR86284.1 flavin-dependent dehydrogenase [Micromonospora pisi]
MPPSASQRFAELATAQQPTDTRIIMRRAVVLGGSIAGLLAARVLSDHADEVLVIERDTTDVGLGPRPGVPQGSQVHALLAAGQAQLERWFPGFTQQAFDAGAPRPTSGTGRVFINGVRRTAPMSRPQVPGLITTRPFLEALVRRRTLAIGNVTLVPGRADGVILDRDRVSGVRYLPDGADEPVTVASDLVVDAMGRSSRLGDWLEENGWPRPPMRRIPIKLNYATALFKRDEQVSDAWMAIAQTTPGDGRIPRIGGINSVEGDRWLMLVAGYDDDRPRRDADDFIARCRDHFPAEFREIAENGQMIGEVATYHQADSRRRDFHELDRLPAGLVAAGDAVASFNPIYGQGMTSAALHASCLSAYLRSGPAPHTEPARAYFAQVRVIVDAAWQVSTFADLALPHVLGPYPPGYRLIKWFSELLLEGSMTDEVIDERLARVTTMAEHPYALARPGTVWRALRFRLRRSRRSRR